MLIPWYLFAFVNSLTLSRVKCMKKALKTIVVRFLMCSFWLGEVENQSIPHRKRVIIIVALCIAQSFFFVLHDDVAVAGRGRRRGGVLLLDDDEEEEEEEEKEEETCRCMPLFAVYVVGCCVCVFAVLNIFIQLNKPPFGS